MDGGKPEEVIVEISVMDINKFILHSKWSKYSEVTQNKIIANHDQLGIGKVNRKREKNIPKDTTGQSATIKNLKAQIALLDKKRSYDTKEANAEED